MPKFQAYGCVNKAGEGVSEEKGFFQIPNAMKFPANRSAGWPSNGFTISELDILRIVLIFIGKSFAKITSQNNPSKRMWNIHCWACLNENF